MRSADRAGVSPVRYMGLPWPEWGETAVALTGALHHLDATACPCGCGQHVDECHDEALRDRWQVHVAQCYAGQVKADFVKDHQADLNPGSLVYLTLLPEGVEPSDPLDQEYDPDRARKNYEEHMRKWGQAPTSG